MPRPTVAPVALVTVRARRIRVFPKAPIVGLPPVELVAPMLEAFEVAPPFIENGGDLVLAPAAPADPTPPAPIARPPKISLKNAPSSMEQLASQWRGGR